ncbi:MAG: cobalt-precorrin-5B (C(1))-methyltransferase [Methanospirillum sp.]|uniref:cobalt-precorrin-5B (C(1))-methyltransferase n=1 Tax=Methanospirillum sp. TaxID=45200 RepID=UPI00236F6D02|nr:cobalt-precorrin-5B (C(1))-methyltransferase [Methanospirillum sp.]MDD1730127.1 cobalt-precorrin-5B (C(1))-methyltransferase [Methanospirillum sp.]
MQVLVVRDPVSGFEYPPEWEHACSNPDDLAAVQSGLAILTSDGTVLKRGFTTGSTAAAAAKASVLSLIRPVDKVDIQTASGIRVTIQACGERGRGFALKYAGDYPGDVTAGMKFIADATAAEDGIEITTGPGVGIWSRENPRYPKGTPAISPPSLNAIQNAISEALAETGLSGVKVCISAEHGEEIAAKTLNAKIGVTGGISVLGSTGFVEPWDDHLEDSFIERISASDHVVITTGRVGLRYSRLLFPDYEVVLVGSRLGAALDHSHGEVIICGLPALILKFINPLFLEGSKFGSVEEMIGTPEFEKRAQLTLHRFCAEKPDVLVILLDREGRIIMKAP